MQINVEPHLEKIAQAIGNGVPLYVMVHDTPVGENYSLVICSREGGPNLDELVPANPPFDADQERVSLIPLRLEDIKLITS
jgi:hypothetical protein